MSIGNQTGPLRSRFADDAEMVELVQEFVQELPGRMESLRGFLRASHFDELRRAAHQLKGAAGGYGFPAISDSAGSVERLLQSSMNEAHLGDLQAKIDELVSLCTRAVAA